MEFSRHFPSIRAPLAPGEGGGREPGPRTPERNTARRRELVSHAGEGVSGGDERSPALSTGPQAELVHATGSPRVAESSLEMATRWMSGESYIRPGIQRVPASGTCAIAAASTVSAAMSSGSRLCTCDFPQARASVWHSIVKTER